MFILFGLRRRGQRLGVLMWPCARCGAPTAHTLTYIKAWFTLFFIPVIPLPVSRKLVCTNCGQRNKFDKSQRESVEQAARAGAARATAIAQAAAQVPGGPMAPPYPNVSAPMPPAPPLEAPASAGGWAPAPEGSQPYATGAVGGAGQAPHPWAPEQMPPPPPEQ